jgi:hypothetical protein
VNLDEKKPVEIIKTNPATKTRVGRTLLSVAFDFALELASGCRSALSAAPNLTRRFQPLGD